MAEVTTAVLLKRITEKLGWYEAEKCRKPKVLRVGLQEFGELLYETEKFCKWDLLEDFEHYGKFMIYGMEIKLVTENNYLEVF